MSDYAKQERAEASARKAVVKLAEIGVKGKAGPSSAEDPLFAIALAWAALAASGLDHAQFRTAFEALEANEGHLEETLLAAMGQTKEAPQ